MKTAKEMYDYSVNNDFGKGWSGWGLKHFKVIEDHLSRDEEALICFMGLHNYFGATQHQGYYAYAITNKRFVFAQKKIFGETFEAVELNNLNDITKQTGIINGNIVFDTFKEKIIVNFTVSVANKLFPVLNEYLTKMKNTNSTSTIKDITEEIRKLKQLLDEGILTKEEFETKKKQLLGL